MGTQLEIGGGSTAGSAAGSGGGGLYRGKCRHEDAGQNVIFALYSVDGSNERVKITYTLIWQLKRFAPLFCFFSRRVYFGKSMSSSVLSTMRNRGYYHTNLLDKGDN